MPENSSMMIVMLIAALICSIASGGLWWFYGRDKDEKITPVEIPSSVPTPSSSNTDSSSFRPADESFTGYYSEYDDGKTLLQRGHAECRDFAIEYNKTNIADPYVGYGVRSSNHTGGLENTCLFYKKSKLPTASKLDTSKGTLKVDTKCLDSKNYPDNFCLSTPYPAQKDEFIGTYSNFDEGAPNFVGEYACINNINTQNARLDFPDKYVGYGVRDTKHTTNPNTCVFYRKSQMETALKTDRSKNIASTPRITNKCTNSKSPDNWCQ